MEKPAADAAGLLAGLARAGLEGAMVLSLPPEEAVMPGGADFETRLRLVLELTQGHEGRLFPALWIHPREKNACKNMETAARQGILAFKMICDSYYPYDDDCLALARTAAALNRPILFHSGILWDGGVTSRYNRPLYFERLAEVPGLRFALAHCGWPWYDECIALYGKLLNTMAKTSAGGAEMFFDLTPGTPRIYRRDLLQKLFGVGYDVGHNILFGSDGCAEDYGADWSRTWMALDDGLYAELEVPEDIRRHIYADNLLRFLGLSGERWRHACPLTGITL
jgi:predicted TIM-barrel fold metal-dependent hydrolase